MTQQLKPIMQGQVGYIKKNLWTWVAQLINITPDITEVLNQGPNIH